MGNPVFLIWIVLIGFLFYFMMIRPQKRARAQQSSMLDHLKPGAQVRTTAQIMGTVVEVGDDWAIVETTPGTRIKFGKPAIVGIILEDEEAGEAGDADEAAESGDAEDAPTPGGIGDAPHSVRDAVPAQDAGPADDAEDAVKADVVKADVVKADAVKAEDAVKTEAEAPADAAEEAEDAQPAAKS